jgi:predicted PurR-regulated permease PerM
MIGAGTFISPLIKIVTTVAILAAAYFFIVKPVLDTTESAFDSVGSGIEGFNDFSPSIQDSIRDAEKIQKKAQESSQAQIDEANKLLDCIADAGGDVEEIERCNRKFDPANP